jgi:hypothetical protein
MILGKPIWEYEPYVEIMRLGSYDALYVKFKP